MKATHNVFYLIMRGLLLLDSAGLSRVFHCPRTNTVVIRRKMLKLKEKRRKDKMQTLRLRIGGKYESSKFSRTEI